jgi:oligopeptidase B
MKHFSPLVLILLLYACQGTDNTHQTASALKPSVFNADPFTAPHPEKKPKELASAFGDKRTDEYYWLNERENPEVVAYLEAENRYTDSVLAPVAQLREQLYQEMKARNQGR